MERALEIFAALSDKTRLRSYRLLVKAGCEVAVCELIDALRESQYNVSKHLQVLKNAGLIKEVKKGRWSLYSAVEGADSGVAQGILNMKEDVFEEDLKFLKKRLALRQNGEIVSCRLAGELMETIKGVKK